MIKRREESRQETVWRKSAAWLRQREGSSDQLDRKVGPKSHGCFFLLLLHSKCLEPENSSKCKSVGQKCLLEKRFFLPPIPPRWEATTRWNKLIWAPPLLLTELWGCERDVWGGPVGGRSSQGQAGSSAPSHQHRRKETQNPDWGLPELVFPLCGKHIGHGLSCRN